MIQGKHKDCDFTLSSLSSHLLRFTSWGRHSFSNPACDRSCQGTSSQGAELNWTQTVHKMFCNFFTSEFYTCQKLSKYVNFVLENHRQDSRRDGLGLVWVFATHFWTGGWAITEWISIPPGLESACLSCVNQLERLTGFSVSLHLQHGLYYFSNRCRYSRCYSSGTSSTAQGGGGSFKDRTL